MKNVNHIVWADLIRVIAILMVICIHCSDPFNVSPEARLNPEYNLWGSIYGAFLRPCVPLFVMLTGMLWLSCNSWGIKFSQFPSCIYLC